MFIAKADGRRLVHLLQQSTGIIAVMLSPRCPACDAFSAASPGSTAITDPGKTRFGLFNRPIRSEATACRLENIAKGVHKEFDREFLAPRRQLRCGLRMHDRQMWTPFPAIPTDPEAVFPCGGSRFVPAGRRSGTQVPEDLPSATSRASLCNGCIRCFPNGLSDEDLRIVECQSVAQGR